MAISKFIWESKKIEIETFKKVRTSLFSQFVFVRIKDVLVKICFLKESDLLVLSSRWVYIKLFV